MITAKGKNFIKQYLTGQAGTIVGAISIGVGGTAEALNDDKLQFEFARIPVIITAYDYTTNTIIFKGSLDESVVGKIYEVGIWTAEVNTAAGNQGSKVITTFDSQDEEWTNETMESTIARIGVDSLKHTPAASATSSSILDGVEFDFSENSSADKFVLAYNVDNSFCASIKFRFLSDSSNYYEFTISAPTTGYKFSALSKGTATIVGAPSWDNITQIEVRTTATSGGSASVEYDGIRVEDVDTVAPEYGLIARKVLASPIVKADGLVQDIEYSLAVTV